MVEIFFAFSEGEWLNRIIIYTDYYNIKNIKNCWVGENYAMTNIIQLFKLWIYVTIILFSEGNGRGEDKVCVPVRSQRHLSQPSWDSSLIYYCNLTCRSLSTPFILRRSKKLQEFNLSECCFCYKIVHFRIVNLIIPFDMPFFPANNIPLRFISDWVRCLLGPSVRCLYDINIRNFFVFWS